MKIKITLSAIILYMLSVNFYVYNFYFTDIDRFYMKLCGFYWPAVLIYGYLLFDEIKGYSGIIHRQVNILGKLSVWFKLILVTFTYQIPITKPVYAYFIFDGLILITFIMVFISGSYRGLFKN